MTALIYFLGFISGAAAFFLLRIIHDSKKRQSTSDISRDFEALLKY